MNILVTLILLSLCIVMFDLRIKKVEYYISTNKIDKPLRFMVITDFHSEKYSKLIDISKTESYDAILIVGDLFDEKKDYVQVINLLKEFNHKDIFFVSGNHEYKNKCLSYPQIKEMLMMYNVHVLDDEIYNYRGMNIIGIQDCRHVGLGNDLVSEKVKINKLMRDYNNDEFNLVMIHRPDHYIQFDRYNIDCMVSGHAHGGQWRIPFILNGFLAPQQGFFPKRAGGKYSLPNGIQIVSRGLAVFPHFYRIFNRPELIFINIKKET